MNKGKLPEFSSFSPKLESFISGLSELSCGLKELLSDLTPNVDHIEAWDQLIRNWVSDDSLPLYVRKFNHAYSRGSEVIHKSGRVLIPSDNGPAHWALSMCFNGNCPSLAELRSLIESDKIPVAFALKGNEKESKYKNTKHEIDQPNKKGWKIAHINPIGLKSKAPLEELDQETIISHFVKFMSPSNMFFFPLKYGGLAEIEEVIGAFNR